PGGDRLPRLRAFCHKKSRPGSRAASLVGPYPCCLRLEVLELREGVVPEGDLLAVTADHVLGEERDLAAAVGGIDHEVGHREAGGVAAERLDDLEARLDRRAEVRDA